MKDISTEQVIDEAIKRLQKIKRGQSRSVIEELYAVRAYCDLLLAAHHPEKREAQNPPQQVISTPQTVQIKDDDDEHSIFEF